MSLDRTNTTNKTNTSELSPAQLWFGLSSQILVLLFLLVRSNEILVLYLLFLVVCYTVCTNHANNQLLHTV